MAYWSGVYLHCGRGAGVEGVGLCSLLSHRLAGQVVKVSVSRAADQASSPAFRVDLFLGQVIPVTLELVIQWLSCRASGATELALGLIGPVSVDP